MTTQDSYYAQQGGTHAPAFVDPATAPHSAVSGPAPNTAGPHSSNLLNKLDPRVDSNPAAHHQDGYTAYDNYTTAAGGTQAAVPGSHAAAAPRASGALGQPPYAGPGAVNPAAQGTTATHHDHHGSHVPTAAAPTAQNVPEGTYGPHRSRLANILDPRVDSTDPEWRRNNVAGAPAGPGPSGMAAAEASHGGAMPAPAAAPAAPVMAGEGRHHIGGYKTHPRHPEVFTMAHPNNPGAVPAHAGPAMAAGAGAGAAAPHSGFGHHHHNRHDGPVNTAVPAAATAAGHHHHHQQQHHPAPVHSAMGGAPRPGGHVPEGTYGPHASRVANALDPRVDSDLDGSRTLGDRFAGEVFAGTGKGGVPKGPQPAVAGLQQQTGQRVESDDSLFRSW